MAAPRVNLGALSSALADPSRRSILESLRSGPKSVMEIVQITGLKQPNVSNHLARMRAAGIVRPERVGRHVFYAIDLPAADVVLRMHELARQPGDTKSPALSSHDGERLSGGPGDGGAARFAGWRGSFLSCIRQGDEEAALSIVQEMLAQRVDLPTMYSEIFEWALHQIDEQVEQGLADIAHEHMASELTERMMARAALFYTPVARSQRSALLGCVAGNWHAIGLRMLGDALKIRGWQTHYLGPNVPTASFVDLVNSLAPDLVIISCGMEEHAAELRRLIEGLKRLRDEDAERLRYSIVVGGRYVNSEPDFVEQLNPDMTARNLSDFLEQINALTSVSRSESR